MNDKTSWIMLSEFWSHTPELSTNSTKSRLILFWVHCIYVQIKWCWPIVCGIVVISRQSHLEWNSWLLHKTVRSTSLDICVLGNRPVMEHTSITEELAFNTPALLTTCICVYSVLHVITVVHSRLLSSETFIIFASTDQHLELLMV